MNPFETLSFIVERAEKGSVAALVTQDNVPIIITKDDDFSFTAYVCASNGEVLRFKKEFDRTTYHKAILELLDEIGEAIGKEVTELRLSSSAAFPECVPKRREERRVERKREEINVEEKVRELKSLPSTYYLIPLVSDNGKLFSFVPEVGGTVEVDFVVKTPVKVNGARTPVSLDAKSLYPVLATLKLDPKLGNPFTTEGSFTFFTAVYVYNGSRGKGKFMGVEMEKGVGKFISVSQRGGARTEELEFLSFPHKANGLYLGFFVKGKEVLVELQSVDMVSAHKEGKFTVNDYVFSSFTLTSREGSLKLEDYDRIMSNFVNLLLSKSNGREVLKDVIEIHSMGPLSLPMVKGVSNNVVSVVDPISFWYSRVYEGSEEVKECLDCPLAEKVRQRELLLNALKRRGYFASFLL